MATKVRTQSVEALPSYEFKPLEPESVSRLIKLKPGPELRPDAGAAAAAAAAVAADGQTPQSAPIEISIVPTNLEVPYETLSWCWGAERPTALVTVEESGQRSALAVKPTIERALLALRQERKPRYLWIDAICINQDDVAEKSRQVRNMPRIYRSAQRVLIWLELTNPGSAVDVIKKTRSVKDVYEIASSRGSKREDLSELLSHPWFGRRWIIQEVAVARRATIVSGKHTADWDDFCRLLNLLHDYHEGADVTRTTSDMDWGVAATSAAFYGSNAYSLVQLVTGLKADGATTAAGSSPAQRLEHLLASCTGFLCERGQDTIFSVLPLAQPGAASAAAGQPDDARTTNPDEISINYGKTPLQVHKDFIRFAISSSGGRADVILRDWALQHPDLPRISWIRSPRPRGLDGENRRVYQRELIGSAEAPIFKAAGPSASVPSVPSFVGQAGLQVDAIVLDSIGAVMGAHLEVISSAWPPFAGWHDTAESPPDHFWQTIVAGLGRDSRDPPAAEYRSLCQRAFSRGHFRLFTISTDFIYLEIQRVFVKLDSNLSIADRWKRFNFGVRHPDQQLKIMQVLQDMHSSRVLNIKFLNHKVPLSREAVDFIQDRLREVNMEAMLEEATYRRLVLETVMGRALFKSADAGLFGLAPKQALPGDL